MADDAPFLEPVVVPDDIRSLQADIDAYHREQRHARRHRWLRRLADNRSIRTWGPLAGVVSGALALTAVVFVVLTVGDPGTSPRLRPSPLDTAAVAPVGAQGGLVADEVVQTQSGTPVRLRSLRPAVVALVPLRCNCADLVASLAGQAAEVDAELILVAPAAQDAEVAALPGRTHRGHVEALFDADHSLADTYGASGLTVLLVSPAAVVDYLQRDVPRDVRLEQHLFAMTTS